MGDSLGSWIILHLLEAVAFGALVTVDLERLDSVAKWVAAESS